jgi:2-hydroxychromene-2-carboxylate isomerase
MATPHDAPIRFYFDYVSPYAYVAWGQIHALAARTRRGVEAVPVVFGALLSAHGTKGPAEVPAKRAYLIGDVYRKARHAGLPLVLPPAHPFNPLLALRVSSLPMEHAARRHLVDALFAAAWGTGGGAETAEQVAAAACRAGLDGDALVTAAGTTETKARLRAQTEEAIALGIFGVPTAVADGELFWGVDALTGLRTFLETREPVPADIVSAWATLPSSVVRRG